MNTPTDELLILKQYLNISIEINTANEISVLNYKSGFNKTLDVMCAPTFEEYVTMIKKLK